MKSDGVDLFQFFDRERLRKDCLRFVLRYIGRIGEKIEEVAVLDITIPVTSKIAPQP